MLPIQISQTKSGTNSQKMIEGCWARIAHALNSRKITIKIAFLK